MVGEYLPEVRVGCPIQLKWADKVEWSEVGGRFFPVKSQGRVLPQPATDEVAIKGELVLTTKCGALLSDPSRKYNNFASSDNPHFRA
jgi:hypothetical protein